MKDRLYAPVRLSIRSSSFEAVVALALGVLMVSLAYVAPLDESFWLDETVTAWIVRGDLMTTLEETFRFQGGTPLYNLIIWCVRSIFSASEVALRIPSLIGVLVATVALWRLGARLFDRTTGLIAGVLFLALPMIAFAGTDARPYALAVAALVLSTLVLCRSIDEGKTRDQFLYTFAAASVFYLHYVIAIALLAHIPFFIARKKEMALEVRPWEVVRALFLLAALVTPSIPHLVYLFRRSGFLEVPRQPVERIVQDLIPSGLLLCLLAALIVTSLMSRSLPRWKLPSTASGLVLILGWVFVPFAVLTVVSAAGDTDLGVSRYFISAEPAIALAIAASISLWPSRWARWICTAGGVLAFVVVVAPPPRGHTREDWRTAAATQRTLADPSTPMLLFVGLPEAKQADWLMEAPTRRYLSTPATTYAMEGRIIPAPWEITPTTNAYLTEVAREHLVAEDEFMLMTRSRDVTRAWLDRTDRLRDHSVQTSYSWNGSIFLYVYGRDG